MPPSSVPSLALIKKLSYHCTPDGKVSRIIYPSGLATDIYYGPQGPNGVYCKTLAYNFADPNSSPACNAGYTTGLAAAVAYTPHGALKTAILGSVSNNMWGYVPIGGVTLTNTYNDRLQPNNIKVTHMNGTTTVTDLDLTYNFTRILQGAYYNNGSVLSVTNNKTGASGRSQSYTYDELNRLKTAQSTATSGADCWGQSFTYDRYANMTGITVTQCSAPTLSLGINTANNRVTNTGYTYDTGGNVLTDGTYTYTWNAEGRMTSAAGVNYTYDADNRRVKKSNGKLYWYGLGGEVLAESDLAGNITSEYIYFNGQRIARKAPSSSNVYYYLADRLGTARVIVSVNINGTVNTPAIVAESDNYPYGGERVVTADTTNNTYKFTAHERDAETGLDHTEYRQYSSNSGRWLSADRYKGGTANPQTLNRYAYVLNTPCSAHDPDGRIISLISPPPPSNPNESPISGPVTGLGGIPISTAPRTPPSPLVAPPIEALYVSREGSEQGKIVDVLNKINGKLAGSKCGSWLSTGSVSGAEAISVLLDNHLIGHGQIYRGNDADPLIGAITGGGPEGFATVVNRDGLFFDKVILDGREYYEGVQGHTYQGGTIQAQASILIHELAHFNEVRGFQHDAADLAARISNAGKVDENCRDLIDGLK